MALADNTQMENNKRKDTFRKVLVSYISDMLTITGEKLKYFTLPGENCYTEKHLVKALGTKKIDYMLGVDATLAKRRKAEKQGVPKLTMLDANDFHKGLWSQSETPLNAIFADYCGNPSPYDLEMDVDNMMNFLPNGGIYALTYNLHGRDYTGSGRSGVIKELGMDLDQAINFSSYQDEILHRKRHKGGFSESHPNGHMLLADAVHAYLERCIERRGVRAKLVCDYSYQGQRLHMLSLIFAVNLPEMDHEEVTEKYYFPDALHKDESHQVEGPFKTNKAYTSAVIKHYLNKGMSVPEVAKHLNISPIKASAVDVWNRGAGKLAGKKVNK